MLPGFSHRKRCSPRAETVHTVGLDSSYLDFHNWYVGMMYSIYTYLVFHITIWIEYALYFLINERYLQLRGFHIAFVDRTRVVFSHKRKIKHIFINF